LWDRVRYVKQITDTCQSSFNPASSINNNNNYNNSNNNNNNNNNNNSDKTFSVYKYMFVYTDKSYLKVAFNNKHNIIKHKPSLYM